MKRSLFTRLGAFVLVLMMALAISSEAFAYTTLKFNSRGADVKTLQSALRSAGYYFGNIDGIYGAQTRNAVKTFQKASGITADGIAGNETQTVLFSGKNNYKTLKLGDTGTAVRKLQNALKEKGYYKDVVDGRYGATTEAAVIKYQKKIGITADGKAGYKTQNALYNGVSSINEGEREDVAADVVVRVSDQHSLYYGCTGPRVKTLQKALKQLKYYKGNIDGVFGDLLRDAVKKFQAAHGLKADGIAGTKTIAAVNKASGYTVSKTFILSVGSNGNEVKNVIKFLKGKGYTVPDGDVFTTLLETAVKQWQKTNGKTETGYITEAQYNKIVLGQEKNTK